MMKRSGRTSGFLPAGKLPPGLLGKLLEEYSVLDESVVAGPGVGEDAAVIDFGGRYLLAKTDPVTFLSEDSPWYAVHVNANDIAAMGGVPRWFLASVLLPEGAATPGSAEEIFKGLSSACRSLGISLCGGHTEITAGLDRTLLTGCMLGEVEPERLKLSSAAETGDDILLTKGIAIEGVSIIAREKAGLLEKWFSSGEISVMKDFVFNPGISVLGEAAAASAFPGVHAMHDPTEGGVSSGLWEVARASGKRMEIEEDRIPVFPQCAKLCGKLGLDPFGLIASGSLLIFCEPGAGRELKKVLGREGISCERIGRVAEGNGVFFCGGGEPAPAPLFERDEITRIL